MQTSHHSINIRPLVTFSVCCYEHERYIAEALGSALVQTYSPLEIVISDDCSQDSTFAIVESIVADYHGPHKIIVNRNDTNLGLAGNVNKIWELSSGEFLVDQAGDDVSLPHRTSTLVNAWLSREPRPDLVYSGLIHIDENGNKLLENTDVVSETPGIADTITGKNTFIAGGAVAAYARAVHFFVGPLNIDVAAEDFVYSFRALLGNGVLGIPEPLVKYRIHSESILGKNWRVKKQNDGGQQEKTKLNARLSILKEYEKAMKVYGIHNLYLRWRLARNIRSTEMLLSSYTKGFVGRLFLILWSFISIRPRVLKRIVGDAASSLIKE